MPSFKPAYLIHGDDHGRIAERRARLRSLAEGLSGPGGLEVFEGEAAAPDAVAAALAALTFPVGRRFLVVDGVERWKDRELDALEGALRDPPPDTTVAFFAREEGRTKAPERLAAIVQAAGGETAPERTVKGWELPKWVAAEARARGIELESGAARALVAHVGERQQRLLRELERLALELGPGASLGPAEIAELTAGSAERRVWALADALVAREAGAALELYLELREQGERLPSLMYWMSARLRLALDVVERLDAGEAPAKIRGALRMPPKAAERFIEDARRSDAEHLRRAVELVADLELQSRGGGTEATEDTAAVRAIAAIAA